MNYKKEVKKLFNLGISKSATFNSISISHNISNDVVTETILASSCNVVLTNFTTEEPHDVNERKCYLVASVIDSTPKTSDRLVVNGDAYVINNIKLDPSDSIYILTVKK